MSKKALIVDNNYFFVQFLSELLEKRGYRVLMACDGKEGIAKLEHGPVDIVFADLIMPKVDVRQFIEFIRMKYQENHFPIVALSGTVIEQLSEIDEIGADYYIPKGPIDKLTPLLNEFMAEMETKPFFPPMDKKVLATGNVFPRRDAMELIDSLLFHQAVIESTGVGIIIVDNDTRIINANRMACEIIGKSSADVVNCPVSDIFNNGDRIKIADGLKQAIQQTEASNASFCSTFHSQVFGTIISPIRLQGTNVGWVVSLAPAFQCDEQATLSHI